MLDFLAFVGHVLYPSPLPGAPPEFTRWQYGLSGTVWGFVMAVGTHIAIACGFFSSLGLSGFALATNVTDLQKTIDQNTRVQLEEAIPNDKIKQCEQIQQKNQGALIFATKILYAHLEAYRELTGHPYLLPNCDEL